MALVTTFAATPVLNLLMRGRGLADTPAQSPLVETSGQVGSTS